MYSVVLMMAMTTTVDAPDCHRSCSGCSGYSSCSGYAGCSGCSGYSSCCGRERHRLFGGHRHSCSGCNGYTSCSGCTGYVGCTGCTGYIGCTGCTGGVIVVPETKPMVKPETVKPPKGEEAFRSGAATIVVSLPADAKLSIDNVATTSTSSERVFQSPELPAGRNFSYTLKAEFKFEGKPVIVTKKVNVRAGAESRVTLGAADLAGVASR